MQNSDRVNMRTRIQSTVLTWRPDVVSHGSKSLSGQAETSSRPVKEPVSKMMLTEPEFDLWPPYTHTTGHYFCFLFIIYLQ